MRLHWLLKCFLVSLCTALLTLVLYHVIGEHTVYPKPVDWDVIDQMKYAEAISHLESGGAVKPAYEVFFQQIKNPRRGYWMEFGKGVVIVFLHIFFGCVFLAIWLLYGSKPDPSFKRDALKRAP